MPNLNEKLEWTDVDQRAVDTARVLAADAVEKVGSGHPGTAMSLAPTLPESYEPRPRRRPLAGT